MNPCLSQLKINFNSKNGRKRSFSYETKASISFIPTRRMNLWCPIIERNEIVTWIQVYANWKMNFSSKNGRKRSFCYESKASMSLIAIRRMCLWFPITGQRRFIREFMLIPIDGRTLVPKNGGKSSFSMKPKHQFIYPNEWNEFVTPNH